MRRNRIELFLLTWIHMVARFKKKVAVTFLLLLWKNQDSEKNTIISVF
jgi:hypothetical protein